MAGEMCVMYIVHEMFYVALAGFVGNMALQKYVPSSEVPSMNMKPLRFSFKSNEKARATEPEKSPVENGVDFDLREVYFLIMHFLSAGPCHRTYGQFWNELLEHQLLPRRYHAWYSRTGVHSGDENDNGLSFPLSYNKLAERYPHVEKDHLVKLLKQLILHAATPSGGVSGGTFSAAAVPTLLGTGSFSLIGDLNKVNSGTKPPPAFQRWPHMQADQVRGLCLREIGGGFSRHHRAPSIRAACYAIAKPSTMVQKMQHIKKLRGHLSAVYCAIFDRSGRYVITGSDDRLVKIWSMETAYCLASCRGHEGDITDLAVSSNDTLVASASNDFIIRVWRLPDGVPISVLRGHTGAVTAIAFSPRPSSVYQLLSSSDDGTCRIWDARYSQFPPRIYVPRPPDSSAGTVKNNVPSSSATQLRPQIFCCAFNANGTVFVTGSSDTLARVWSTNKLNTAESEPNHEIDILAGHENDVNYVQFSGCNVASRFSAADPLKEEKIPKFKNTGLNHDNIVTCSRDGSAIIWIPRSRRSHGKAGRWTRAYHLKVPPPPMPPQPPRGGPRQRILPTPRGVNMIVWSLDNRFVLAAIMDCRICVWNAVDGSLVHSLKGHSESTFVLDVHPFNPRIAMSAGYDGKTIVWDIWEGTPIREYEIGRFKLVDGKFSPDGTSIILSDDVGQLYILSTGQGEYQQDAKYEQFFLGDYRPLIQDTHGTVLDQILLVKIVFFDYSPYLFHAVLHWEMLAMIPYPDPYQSMYQKRRLGALGIEWRPSSVRFAVGPDFNLDQGFQMLPIADLDLLIDPLPEFVDAMDWEPEIEVLSDDTDSEYNVTEECSSGREKGSLSFNSSGDPECSSEDSEVEGTHIDVLRRSKRKKQKVEIMTSSGRRVKRKNLDECGGEVNGKNRRKSRHGQKASRRKSSSSKSFRPQRAAARNALNLFSRLTGVSADGEEDRSESSLESESMLQDSSMGSEESDTSSQNKQHNHSKGKEVLVDESDGVVKPHECSESRLISGNRRLVVKFPTRALNKSVPAESTTIESEGKPDLVGSSFKSPQKANEENQNCSQDPECSRVERNGRVGNAKVENDLELFDAYKRNIKWGGFKARTSKQRLKMGEHLSLTTIKDVVSGQTLENRFEKFHSSSETEYNGVQTDEMVHTNEQQVEDGTPEDIVERQANDKFPKQDPRSFDDATTSSLPYTNGFENHAELKESKMISKDDESPELEVGSSMEDESNVGSHGPLSESPYTKQKLTSEGPYNDGTAGPSSLHVDLKGEANSVSQKSNSNDRMYSAVYRRLRSSRARSNPEGDSEGVIANTSNVSSPNLDLPQATTNGVRRTRSMGLGETIHEANALGCDIKLREENDGSKDSNDQKTSINACDEHPSEEWGSGSRVTVGLRSARNRRSSYHIQDSTLTNRKKSHQPVRNSWLMLSTHGEGSRYIPQLGDEVVYLRQGHQEYISRSGTKEVGPWITIKGNIRAVEFCRVKALQYAPYRGSGDGCCKMTLQFVDSSSSVAGKSFNLTLPELNDLPDFLVERSQYDAAIQRNWVLRDKCQVWWENPGEKNGSWWEGRIVGVKPKSQDFPDSPWDKYAVRYKGDPSDPLQHSPWELRDAETQWDPPGIDNEIRENMLCSLDELEASASEDKDRYGIRKLKQVSQKDKFLNRFPVPLSLDVIQSRLENNYYRSLEAMKHDISVMLSNAEAYFERKAELLSKIRRLSEWFNRTLLSL
ncbi:hypothetical protein RHGRI_012690 [Rhododendron griersonianum]|uniref:Bromo domain-containing protein n=1 Tax=Rhododendron griersonianum TaxID=479676 RepID=A0AAV6KSN7_9ERIC|nr:hypothetical protein RHGRI_012690 [Rhododendron griersonianum]